MASIDTLCFGQTLSVYVVVGAVFGVLATLMITMGDLILEKLTRIFKPQEVVPEREVEQALVRESPDSK